MRLFSIFLAILVSAIPAVANASCTKAPPAPSLPQFAPLMLRPGGAIQPYYCAASPAALSVGDLSPSEWGKRVQVCTTNCTYEPMSPTDPRSALIATSCGSGYHDTQYYVQMPNWSKQASNSLVDSCLSNSLQPSKGAAPSPSPHPRER
jgi:hypothetical protein